MARPRFYGRTTYVGNSVPRSNERVNTETQGVLCVRAISSIAKRPRHACIFRMSCSLRTLAIRTGDQSAGIRGIAISHGHSHNAMPWESYQVLQSIGILKALVDSAVVSYLSIDFL